MDEKLFKKIKIINLTTFFFLWIIIFIIGADKPPPIGFLSIVFLVALLDVAQFFYLNRFLPELKKKTKGLFFSNLFFFFLGGIIVSFLTIIININILSSLGFLNMFFWVGSIIVVSMIYAVCFYIFNLILLKKLKQS